MCDNINIFVLDKKYKKIFEKYNFKYNRNILDNDNLFIELCKVPNINYNYIKSFINSNVINFRLKNIENKIGFDYILGNFDNLDCNSGLDNVMNIIYLLKVLIKYFDKKYRLILLDKITQKLNLFINNKVLYSSLKSFYISVKKTKILKYEDNNFDLDKILDKLNNSNINNIENYILKLIKFIDSIDNFHLSNVITILYNLLDNDSLVNISNILFLLNKCISRVRLENNDLMLVLNKCSNDIYNYIYFMNNNKLVDKIIIINFVQKLGYNLKSFSNIDNLNLKRGFIFGLINLNDRRNYLLKYQPNKSVMELIINCYLRTINSINFLLPNNFYINSDNSYFYIIEKYDNDLYKYFNYMGSIGKYLNFKTILKITLFIMECLELLHNNNIIHSDLKLENIVLNYNDSGVISSIKLIDFDVAIFDKIPNCLLNLPDKYDKIIRNNKIRGTKIYMLNSETMSFKNDIYSFGILCLLLLYKNVKLILGLKISLTEDKKLIIKYQSLIKKLTILRDNFVDNNSKLKMLNLVCNILVKDNMKDFFEDNLISDFNIYRDFILSCIKNKYSINDLIKNYRNIFMNI